MSVQETSLVRRSFTLKDLTDGYVEIEKQIEEAGGEVNDEILDLHRIAKDLMANKLDRVARAKEALEAHNIACKKQIEYNTWMIDQIDNMITESVKSTDGKRIDGIAFVASQKKNPPSVNIIDESVIPAEYKNVKVEIKAKFPMTNMAEYSRFKKFIVGRDITPEAPITEDEKSILNDCFEITVDKKNLLKALKEKKTITGAEIQQNTRVDLKSGTAKKEALLEASHA